MGCTAAQEASICPLVVGSQARAFERQLTRERRQLHERFDLDQSAQSRTMPKITRQDLSNQQTQNTAKNQIQLY